MTFQEIVHHRRSVRIFKKEAIDENKVKQCLQWASLAPNSSNMQLWEFHHITDAKTLELLSQACLGQSAATTAQQMLVFVTRRDLYKQRAKKILELETLNIQKNSPPDRQAHRIKNITLYYGRVMPFLYANLFGILGILRKVVVHIVGFFRSIVYQVSESDMRVVVHKTCALAAQTFMLGMASEGYDTCPMEGFDSKKVKKILGLPRGAEVNMVIGCGLRENKGIWGDRMRIPFEEIYHKH
jgi:nitroreductase